MVRVAVCPKCSHESVMFDQPDSDQWARCPECRTYFQIKQASARDIPQLVMTEDEALLAEEESEASKETVDSAALETRWDTRRTINAVSTETFVGSEPTTSSVPHEAPSGSEELSPPESGKDAAKRTVSDLSALATWRDLPIDQIEAQARAEKAGDTPVPVASETPTLHLRRSRDGNEAAREKKSPESTEDSGDRFDKWFQAKATIYDFTPPTFDETENDIADEAQPLNEAAVSPNFDADDRSELDIDSASDEQPSSNDAEPESTESTDVSHDQDDARATWPPAGPQARPVPIWARRSRRRSPLRMFVMIVFGGILGVALGYYALLWLFGPQSDFLNASRFLPSAILPREFRAPVVKLPTNDAATTETAGAPELTAGDDELIDAAPIDIEQPVAQEESSKSAATDGAGGAVKVAGAPSFSADELAVALSKAKESRAGLVTGDFDDSALVKRTKGQSYMAFTDLAQKATFVDRSSNATYASALEQEVQELVRTTLAEAHAQSEVARLVPIWIKSTKRTHAGIFFAGHVAREEVRGAFVEWQIDMGHDSITVLADASKALVNPPTRPVVILGWIVDNPAGQVTGYTGQAQQAVWAGHIIPLE